MTADQMQLPWSHGCWHAHGRAPRRVDALHRQNANTLRSNPVVMRVVGGGVGDGVGVVVVVVVVGVVVRCCC